MALRPQRSESSPCVLCRRTFFALVFALLPLWAQAATQASNFIEERAHTVLGIFNNRALSPQQQEDRLREVVVKSFDVPTIARFVLGRHWALISPAERNDFTKAFEHYMVHVYASRFAQYPDSKVALTGEREEQSGRVVVHSQIQWRGATKPAKVDWWVKKSEDGYKILDVNIEGVSQLVSLRDEFAAVIQQHDGKVAGLIDHLKEKTGS